MSYTQQDVERAVKSIGGFYVGYGVCIHESLVTTWLKRTASGLEINSFLTEVLELAKKSYTVEIPQMESRDDGGCSKFKYICCLQANPKVNCALCNAPREKRWYM